ncbi:MAG: ParA family protein [Xanthobacteraceae bacterium]
MGARVLAIANRKGGTGKSTVAVNLAAELGARGYRVLVVDLDPQGHAGLGYGIFAGDEASSIHAVFRSSRPDLRARIRATGEPGVDVIAADRNFDGQTGLVDPRCLARAFDSLKPDYDVVLLDSPPVAANIIVCALLAADGVVVPTALDYLSLDGVQQFIRSYHHVVHSLGAALLGLAIAPMKVDLRANMQRALLARLSQGFGSHQVLRGIYTDVGVAEAFHHRVPLRRYRAHSRAVEDFRVMADDVERRFNLH